MTRALPRLFIGSSTEGLDVAHAVQQELSNDADVTVWNQGVFSLGSGTLERLLDALAEFDFAVLVLTADDFVTSHGADFVAPRDNVLLELGMFLGRLGRRRTVAVVPHAQSLKLPSDLAGITLATYKSPSDGNLQKALGVACTNIRASIRETCHESAIVLGRAVVGITKNVSAASLVEHPAFRDEIAAKCHEWKATSSEWAQKTVVVRHNYSQLLLDVYANAQQSIFSTSVPDYRRMWLSPTGEHILRTQCDNKLAHSTRVFIFDRRDDVTDEDRALFAQHAKARVEVMLYFDGEDNMFMFPPDLGRDWTIVDEGRAIGVTRSVADYYEARWYFHVEDQVARFLDYRKRLLRVSEPLNVFLGQPH